MRINLKWMVPLALVTPTVVWADDPYTVVVNSTETRSVDCVAGMKVVVQGDHNALELMGHCDSINVAGSDNKITSEAVGVIKLTGSRNTLTYKSGIEHGASVGKPEISDRGRGNELKQVE